MRLWAATGIVLIALCASFGYWLNSNGFDCYPNCSTAQKVTGWSVWPLALAFVALLVTSVVRSVRASRRRRAV
jgi:hypothetical protein